MAHELEERAKREQELGGIQVCACSVCECLCMYMERERERKNEWERQKKSIYNITRQ